MIQLSKEDELFHKRTGQWGGIYLSDNPLIERKLDDYKKAEQGSETEEKNINQKSEYVETEKIV